MGRDVVLIDREREGFGSTAASTAMLQWEIDLKLSELAALYGFAAAAEVYRLSFQAVEGLRRLVGDLTLTCGFSPRQTVYFAAGESGPVSFWPRPAYASGRACPAASSSMPPCWRPSVSTARRPLSRRAPPKPIR